MRYGYARVSRPEQRLDLQVDALEEAGCDAVFSEKASGARGDRPELDALLGRIGPGDTLVVWKLDRLARSTRQLLSLSDRFEREGIDLVSLHERIDTSTPMGRMWFTMTAAMAELERDMIVERTRAGLEAARAKGVRLGPPRRCGKQVETARALVADGHTVKDACERCGISRQTYYRWAREEQDDMHATEA